MKDVKNTDAVINFVWEKRGEDSASQEMHSLDYWIEETSVLIKFSSFYEASHVLGKFKEDENLLELTKLNGERVKARILFLKKISVKQKILS